MDLSVTLEMDRRFRDFNLCVYWEPSLSPEGHFSESRLLQTAYLIRKRDKSAIAEFADALARTIRRETFQAFQKIHGPRPISYSDWYCAKLEQFFGVLLYQELSVLGLGRHGEPGPPQTDQPWKEGEGILYGQFPLIQRDAIDRAFSSAEIDQVDWFAVVDQLAAAGPQGVEVLEKWLAQRAARSTKGFAEPRENKPSHRTQRAPRQGKRRAPRRTRDAIIRASLENGAPRHEICEGLDKASIPVTPGMKKLGLGSWAEGWEDPEVRPNIQTLFSKSLKPD